MHPDTATRKYRFQTTATDPAYLTTVFKSEKIDLVVMEACGPSGWINDLAQSLGLETFVCSTNEEAWRWANVNQRNFTNAKTDPSGRLSNCQKYRFDCRSGPLSDRHLHLAILKQTDAQRDGTVRAGAAMEIDHLKRWPRGSNPLGTSVNRSMVHSNSRWSS